MNDKNQQVSIHHSESSTLSVTLLNKYIVGNFSWGTSNLELKGFEKFMEFCKENADGDILKSKIQGGYQYFVEIEHTSSFDRSCFSFYNYGSDEFYLDVFSNDMSVLNKLNQILSEYIDDKDEYKVYKTNFYLGQGLQSKTETYNKETFNSIIPDYYPDFTDINEFYKQFMNSSESIFILSGESGTGKSKFFSYMLKHLMDNPSLLKKSNAHDNNDDFFEYEKNIKVAYVKDENILSIDQFWISLSEQAFDIVILDDLDGYLSPRGDDSNENASKFISQLLSFTDGIVKNKTKFLISTNKEINSIDNAILRDGRLFSIFSFSRLSNSEAETIWLKEGLDLELFKEEFNENDSILQSNLGSIIEKLKSNNGKPLPSFIKDGSKIDIANKYRERKVGFNA